MSGSIHVCVDCADKHKHVNLQLDKRDTIGNGGQLSYIDRQTYPLQVLYLSGEPCVHLGVLSVRKVHIPLQDSIIGVCLLKKSNHV